MVSTVTNASNYLWSEFYQAFANKLLEYKDDRKKLIGKLRKIEPFPGFSNSEMVIYKSADDGKEDIDPFTIFSMFNRGVKQEKRIELLNKLASEFDIDKNIQRPDTLKGIPVSNPQKTTFFTKRQEMQVILIVYGLCLRLQLITRIKEELLKKPN